MVWSRTILGGIIIYIIFNVTVALPWLLSFAAGAMIHVAAEEMILEMSQGNILI